MARVFLNTDQKFLVANDGSELIGTAGSEQVVILEGVTGADVSSSVERIDLPGDIADFTFSSFGATLTIRDTDGNIVATVSDAGGKTLAFGEGSLDVVFADGALTVGGETVTGTPAAITPADTAIDDTEKSESAPDVDPDPDPTENDPIRLTTDSDTETGDDNNDTFVAEDGELNSGDVLAGEGGDDVLTNFNESEGVAVSPRTSGIETFVMTNQANDRNSVADNNVGGYSTQIGNISLDGTIEVDVEIDGGRMVGVERWENFDSRADIVIEDARDGDDTNGTFTADITVAMVSTDPGNVDYAVYFDEPVNVSTEQGTITLQILDQENADTVAGSGISPFNNDTVLEENFYAGASFQLVVDGQVQDFELEIAPEDLDAANESYSAYAAALQAVADANNVPVTVTVGDEFTIADSEAVFKTGAEIVITADENITAVEDSTGFIVAAGAEPGQSDIFFNPDENNERSDDLIKLNVEFDDVGKGSMGGDAMFGAMSTGRQTGDDGTSDSIGIQQFDIEVDRSSQLQTIASTNNSLEVVTIVNGENDGPNNTTTASDEMMGDLTVRGNANAVGAVEDLAALIGIDIPALNGIFPGLGDALDLDGGVVSGIIDGLIGPATDGPMPGAVPQHNIFGFTDVRQIDGSAMIGELDITAVLTEETVEKYLEIQDGGQTGEEDDVLFDYDLGTSDDEFLLQMSADALNSAGTGSREDFNLDIDGNDGNDVITTNIGGTLSDGLLDVGEDTIGAVKVIDEQGQDYYLLQSDNEELWYNNSVFNNAATFDVHGGAGNDVIWTLGYGNFMLADGTGEDVIYTDNSGVLPLFTIATNIDRNLLEHEQIDYAVGSVWILNGEDSNGAINGEIGSFDVYDELTGATNERFDIATKDGDADENFSSGSVVVRVEFDGLSGNDNADENEYLTSKATINLTSSDYDEDGGDATVSVTEQVFNQALKRAINDDPKMSQVLEAADGPGNSLIIYSKIDGSVIDEDTLNIVIEEVTVNGDDDFDIIDGWNDAYEDEGFFNVASLNPLVDDATGDSTAESDNVIDAEGDGEHDVFVLSTNDEDDTQPDVNEVDEALEAWELNSASNETIVWNSGFGTDTVFNFDAAGEEPGEYGDGDPGDEGAGILAPDSDGDGVDGAEDVFDFSEITGGTNTLEEEFSDEGDEVVIAEFEAVDTDGNGTLSEEEVVDFFNLNGGDDGDTEASEHILIAVKLGEGENNAGEVWSISDGSGDDDASAMMEGTINLIGTSWASFTDDNIA